MIQVIVSGCSTNNTVRIPLGLDLLNTIEFVLIIGETLYIKTNTLGCVIWQVIRKKMFLRSSDHVFESSFIIFLKTNTLGAEA